MSTKPPTSFQGPDGRWQHTFRQSDLNRMRKCAEQHRRHMLRMDSERTSAAMMVGTAVHAGIEMALDRTKAGETVLMSEQVAHAIAVWETMYWEAEYSGVAIGGMKEVPEQAIEACTLAWQCDVLPALRQAGQLGGEVERAFTVPFWDDDRRTVSLQGTADYVTPTMIFDWKTGSGNGGYKREGWKYRRGYETTQHAVYAAAMALADGLNPTADGTALRSFRYVRLSRSGAETDVLDVAVLPSDVRFLALECASLAQLIEARASAWPLGPTGWWCSPLWCDAWDSCRGATGGMQS